jgi:hypothetical protein
MTERAPAMVELHATLPLQGGRRVVVRVEGGRVQVTNEDGTKPLGLHAEDIAEVTRRDNRVEVALVRGAPLVFATGRGDELDAAIVSACRVVPELTHALRSLGSSRLRGGGNAQREFFAPLLEARRRAEESVGRAAVVQAFDPDRLARAVDAYVMALATQSADARPAARRAFAAQVREAVEPLRAALDDVRRTAAAAADPPDDARVSTWRAWSAALQRMFAAADRCWSELHPAAVPGARPADRAG